MKTSLLISLSILIGSQAFSSVGVHHTGGLNTITLSSFDYSNNLLVNNAKTKFTSGQSSVVVKDIISLSGNDNFKIAGMGDRVEFQSISMKDWYFADKVVYRHEMRYTSDPSNPATYNTMVFTALAHHNSDALYELHAIKYRKGNHDWFQLVGAYSQVVPEPSTYALIVGFTALSFVMIRRRKNG